MKHISPRIAHSLALAFGLGAAASGAVRSLAA